MQVLNATWKSRGFRLKFCRASPVVARPYTRTSVPPCLAFVHAYLSCARLSSIWLTAEERKRDADFFVVDLSWANECVLLT